MMQNNNLPPGVTLFDLPGNSKKDVAFEKWAEDVEDIISDDIRNIIESDAHLDNLVDYNFFADAEFEDIEPGVQAEKIENYVERYMEEQR